MLLLRSRVQLRMLWTRNYCTNQRKHLSLTATARRRSSTKLESQDGVLKPTPPFDFSKSLDFLADFPPMREDLGIDGRTLARATSLKDKTVVFRVKATGTINQPRLHYTLYSKTKLLENIRNAIIDRIAFFLSLKDDLAPFYQLARQDDDFRPVLERLYGLHHVKFGTPFECACWAVLSQRTLMAEARKTKGAMTEKFGGSLEVEGEIYRAFPGPERLGEASRDELFSLIRNRRRTECLMDVARAFGKVDEKFLRNAEHGVLKDWLHGIKGIGEWSARLILLRGLGRMEELAVEKRLLSAASSFYGKGESISEERLGEIAERYGVWKGYWAYYLRAAALSREMSVA